MSGRRPDRTRALNFRSTFRECRASAAPGCADALRFFGMAALALALQALAFGFVVL